MINENGIEPKWQDLKPILGHYEKRLLEKLKDECLELTDAINSLVGTEKLDLIIFLDQVVGITEEVEK